MDEPRMTIQTRAVLCALLTAEGDRDFERYGLEIIRVTGLTASTIYPILQRLLAVGWISARREDDEIAHGHGRPARRYYRLTVPGRDRVTHVLNETRAQRGLLAQLELAAQATAKQQPVAREGRARVRS